MLVLYSNSRVCACPFSPTRGKQKLEQGGSREQLDSAPLMMILMEIHVYNCLRTSKIHKRVAVFISLKTLSYIKGCGYQRERRAVRSGAASEFLFSPHRCLTFITELWQRPHHQAMAEATWPEGSRCT